MIFRNTSPRSVRSVLLERALWAVKLKASQEDPAPKFNRRDYSKSILSPAPPEHLRRRFTVLEGDADGGKTYYLASKGRARAAPWADPPRPGASDPARRGGSRPRTYVLFLHGGSYVVNFTRQHWGFLARLAERTGCLAIAPDYPLAPQKYYADAYKMLLSLYARITEEVGAENLVLMGDSAGGGLALGLSQVLSYRGLPQPARLVLISPWLDVTMSNPYIEEIDPLDPFLSLRSLKEAGASWARGANPRKPPISPIYGRMAGLAPISLFIGTKDVLIADCRKFRGVARAEGVTIDYYEYEGMLHDWVLLNFPEAKKAFGQIADIVVSAGSVFSPLGLGADGKSVEKLEPSNGTEDCKADF